MNGKLKVYEITEVGKYTHVYTVEAYSEEEAFDLLEGSDIEPDESDYEAQNFSARVVDEYEEEESGDNIYRDFTD